MSKLYEAFRLLQKDPIKAKKMIDRFVNEAAAPSSKPERNLNKQQRAFLNSYLDMVISKVDAWEMDKKEFIRVVSEMSFDEEETSYQNVIGIAKRLKSMGYFDDVDVREDRLGGKHLYVELNKKSATYLWTFLQASEKKGDKPSNLNSKEEITEGVEDLTFRISEPDDDMDYIIRFDNSEDSMVFQKSENQIGSSHELARVVKPYTGEFTKESVPKGTLEEFYGKETLSDDDINEIYDRITRYVHPIYDVYLDGDDDLDESSLPDKDLYPKYVSIDEDDNAYVWESKIDMKTFDRWWEATQTNPPEEPSSYASIYGIDPDLLSEKLKKAKVIPANSLASLYKKKYSERLDNSDQFFEIVGHLINQGFTVNLSELNESRFLESSEQAIADERPGISTERGSKREKRKFFGSKLPKELEN